MLGAVGYFAVRAALCITLGYKTYSFKYLHLCPALLTKFNSTHFKNLRYSICFIDIVWQFVLYSQSPLCEG